MTDKELIIQMGNEIVRLSKKLDGIAGVNRLLFGDLDFVRDSRESLEYKVTELWKDRQKTKIGEKISSLWDDFLFICVLCILAVLVIPLIPLFVIECLLNWILKTIIKRIKTKRKGASR